MILGTKAVYSARRVGAWRSPGGPDEAVQAILKPLFDCGGRGVKETLIFVVSQRDTHAFQAENQSFPATIIKEVKGKSWKQDPCVTFGDSQPHTEFLERVPIIKDSVS